MIMIVKTPGSQMGSPAAAEEGGEEMGGEKCESGERSEVQARSTVASTVSKARSRSREVVTLDEEPRISLRVSTKLPSAGTKKWCRPREQLLVGITFNTAMVDAKEWHERHFGRPHGTPRPSNPQSLNFCCYSYSFVDSGVLPSTAPDCPFLKGVRVHDMFDWFTMYAQAHLQPSIHMRNTNLVCTFL